MLHAKDAIPPDENAGPGVRPLSRPKPPFWVDARMLEASGIGVYLRSILRRLSGLAERHDVVLWGDHDRLAAFVGDHALPFSVRHCGEAPYSARSALMPLGRPQRAPTLWVPHYNAPILGAGRLFVTVHDILHLRTDIVPRPPIQQVYARALMGSLRRQADHVFFISEFTRREFVGRVGPPRGASTVVPNGVDDSWRDLGRRPPKPALDFPYFLCVGNQLRHKNLAAVLDAFASCCDRIPEHLVIIGNATGLKTPEHHPLLAPGAHPRIHNLGQRPFSFLQSAVFHARALVAPSRYEGFGLPPIEALACGTRVIASRIDIHQEVLEDCAEWFHPDSVPELVEALTRAEPASTPRERVEALLRRYDWDACAARLQEAFLAPPSGN